MNKEEKPHEACQTDSYSYVLCILTYTSSIIMLSTTKYLILLLCMLALYSNNQYEYNNVTKYHVTTQKSNVVTRVTIQRPRYRCGIYSEHTTYPSNTVIVLESLLKYFSP